jgi:hypothetical protein
MRARFHGKRIAAAAADVSGNRQRQQHARPTPAGLRQAKRSESVHGKSAVKRLETADARLSVRVQAAAAALNLGK